MEKRGVEPRQSEPLPRERVPVGRWRPTRSFLGPSQGPRLEGRRLDRRRLSVAWIEQLAAVVVTTGLAAVSYWLFFSWAQGGGVRDRRQLRPQALEAAPGLQQPLLGGSVVEGGDVAAHIVAAHREPLGCSDGHDLAQGSSRIL
jgi:hypothetical protein